jgi:glutamate racemase
LIGIFDSGVGGLSVWREIVKLFPDEHLVYLGDQAFVPYGSRSLEEVRALTTRCAKWLIERGCDIVVVACNTATGAALNQLRIEFPHVDFVGMEPAIKPATQLTQTGVIGVLATPATFQSPRYSDLIERFGRDVKVIERACFGWVDFIESGKLQRTNSAPGFKFLAPLDLSYVHSLLYENADVIVLGCTHFPFLESAIRYVMFQWRKSLDEAFTVSLIDPAPAIAQQTLRVRKQRGDSPTLRELSHRGKRLSYFTTGSAMKFESIASNLLGERIEASSVVI